MDKRCSIGLGFLNVNGWDDTSKDDVENAILSKSLEIFSLVETKKKPHSNRIKINGCKVFEVRRNGDPDEGDSTPGLATCLIEGAYLAIGKK